MADTVGFRKLQNLFYRARRWEFIILWKRVFIKALKEFSIYTCRDIYNWKCQGGHVMFYWRTVISTLQKVNGKSV